MLFLSPTRFSREKRALREPVEGRHANFLACPPLEIHLRQQHAAKHQVNDRRHLYRKLYGVAAVHAMARKYAELLGRVRVERKLERLSWLDRFSEHLALPRALRKPKARHGSVVLFRERHKFASTGAQGLDPWARTRSGAHCWSSGFAPSPPGVFY